MAAREQVWERRRGREVRDVFVWEMAGGSRFTVAGPGRGQEREAFQTPTHRLLLPNQTSTCLGLPQTLSICLKRDLNPSTVTPSSALQSFYISERSTYSVRTSVILTVKICYDINQPHCRQILSFHLVNLDPSQNLNVLHNILAKEPRSTCTATVTRY